MQKSKRLEEKTSTAVVTCPTAENVSSDKLWVTPHGTYFATPFEDIAPDHLVKVEREMNAERAEIDSLLERAKGPEGITRLEHARIEEFARKVTVFQAVKAEFVRNEEIKRLNGVKPKCANQLIQMKKYKSPLANWLQCRASQSGGGKYIDIPQTAEELRKVPPRESARLKEVLRRRQEKRAQEQQQQQQQQQKE